LSGLPDILTIKSAPVSRARPKLGGIYRQNHFLSTIGVVIFAATGLFPNEKAGITPAFPRISSKPEEA
jgi:hypothetical protein